MYETRNVRPYYTIPHLECYGISFKKFTGFEYKEPFYIISSKINSSAYFETSEMREATKYFAKIWTDTQKTNSILRKIKTVFKEAVTNEKWAWKQNWLQKNDGQLLEAARNFDKLILKTLTAHIVSQPQHIVSLEIKINKLLDKYSNTNNLLAAVTYFPGKLPWTREENEINKIAKNWSGFTTWQQNEVLRELVKKYGWINEVEGNKPFDTEHYRQKIIDSRSRKIFVDKSAKIPKINLPIPNDLRKLGRLIGELGFLRFWSRYHMLYLHFHLNKILIELVKRSKNTNLEFATVKEIGKFFKKEKINLAEIIRRKHGYASYLKNGKSIIVTGNEANELKRLTEENLNIVDKLTGSIANKGKVVGRVRIISFVDKNYDKQVTSFRQGEILVTGMTRPQIVHLCKKASAIITDEGGITCHAAIISRELNIPCIIGTKIATKILQDGDYVEVDANNGMIKIINNKRRKI